MTRTLYGLMALAFLMALWLRDPLLALLALLLGLLAGLTALWDRYALAEVTYVRRLGTPRMFVGEETDLTIEITNAKPLPLAWLKAEDEFPAEMALARGLLSYSHKPNRRLLTNLLALRFYERVRKQYQMRAGKRGVLAFGPVKLHAGDLFGFGRQERVIEQTDELVVYPRVVPVTALGLPASYPFGDAATRRRITDDPLRITGARSYVPGDNPRYVHWKATARRGELQTKTFDAGRDAADRHLSGRPDGARDAGPGGGVPGVRDHRRGFGGAQPAGSPRGCGSLRQYLAPHSAELVRLPASRQPDQWDTLLDALARVLEHGRGRFRALPARRTARPALWRHGHRHLGDARRGHLRGPARRAAGRPPDLAARHRRRCAG